MRADGRVALPDVKMINYGMEKGKQASICFEGEFFSANNRHMAASR